MPEYFVESNAPPDIILGSFDCCVELHQEMGRVRLEILGDKLYINGKEVITFFSPEQQGEREIQGYELLKELAGKPVLNASVLGFLFNQQTFIPRKWKRFTGVVPSRWREPNGWGHSQYIYFWGTLFRGSIGGLYVARLDWEGLFWNISLSSLAGNWRFNEPAACLVE